VKKTGLWIQHSGSRAARDRVTSRVRVAAPVIPNAESRIPALTL
jgi:hypothetical protein